MLSSTSTSSTRYNQIGSQSYKIITQYGDMLVVKQGIQHQPSTSQTSGGGGGSGQQEQQQQQQQQQTRPVIMTFHDLGLNSELQFATFCECDEVRLMLQTFTMIHVNFIGQEFPNSSQTNNNLPDDFKYPSVEQMAESIVDICTQLRVRSFIALAVGAGAHIVGSLALMRPDLVDGLFLINPVISSCSITEWLYFKMSAIASNHHIGGSSSGGSDHHNHHHSHHHHSHHHHHGQHQSSQDTHSSDSSSVGGAPKSPSGIRRLLNAAHLIHLPHHHNHHNNNNNSKDVSPDESRSTTPEGKQQQQQQEDSLSVGQASVDQQTSGSNISLGGSSSNKHPMGSRLRQLILSRNFRLGGHHHHQQQQPHATLSRTNSTSSTATSSGSAVVRTASGGSASADSQHKQVSIAGDSTGGGGGSQRGSNDSIECQQQQRINNKRPPIEYLMYHHFGPASFQRYRRSSDTPMLMQQGVTDSPGHSHQHHRVGGGGGGAGSGDRPSSHTSEKLPISASSSNDNSSSSIDSNHDSRHSSPASSSTTRTRRAQRAAGTCSRSHDSLQQAGRCRSGSMCMTASYLASFSSERQRQAYMHGVYKHYFNQINSHNLWLFAQSFAKRRTLNLRKDCGAAAHAAAAAAALGTSICTAIVGVSPANRTNGNNQLRADVRGAEKTDSVRSGGGGHETQAATDSGDGSSLQRSGGDNRDTPIEGSSGGVTAQTTSSTTVMSSNTNTTTSSSSSSIRPTNSTTKASCQQAHAQVAGTKVKRTFTCQTLIMCSSVQMHCERAFKLMSLLNPLQATWIKTDQLLVLEERPDKVCQALRLFLQGIGYSMSTYERRLRLNSAPGSACSADSNGSVRSLNEKG